MILDDTQDRLGIYSQQCTLCKLSDYKYACSKFGTSPENYWLNKEKCPSFTDTQSMKEIILRKLALKGGPGSGHFGHAGRPGKVGGSAPKKSASQARSSELRNENLLRASNFSEYLKNVPFNFYEDYYKAPASLETLLDGVKMVPKDKSLDTNEWAKKELSMNDRELRELKEDLSFAMKKIALYNLDQDGDGVIDNENVDRITDVDSVIGAVRSLCDVRDEKTGMEIALNNITFNDRPEGSVTFSAKIISASGESGEFQFSLLPDGEGAHLDLMTVPISAQGSGFGARLAHRFEKVVGALGVDRVTLEANIDVGGYTWARLGYDFQDVGDSFVMAEGLFSEYISRYGEDSLDMDDFMQNIRHSWEIAAFVGEDGYKIGKKYMLGSRWYGVKYLWDDEVGEAYYESVGA